MEAKRIEFIDTAKGMCIMLVVLTHVLDDCYSLDHPLKLQLEPIRMPFYFVLSGLFFKTYDGLWDFCVRKINKILVPYIFFFVLFVAISFTDKWFGAMVSNWQGPLWFLLCLFEMNVIFYVLRSFIKNDYFLIAIILLLGIAFTFTGRLPLRLSTACSCLPFFAFGYFLRSKTMFLTEESSWLKTIVLLILTIVLTTILGDMCSYQNNEYDMNIISLYLCGIIGAAALLLISKHLRAVPFVSFIGRYSLIILLCHYAVIKLTMNWFHAFDINVGIAAIMHYVVVIIISSLLIFPLKRYLPWFVAQKDLFGR